MNSKYFRLFGIASFLSLALNASLPAFALDRKSSVPNVVSEAARINNAATKLVMQGKYDQAISLYRSLIADYPDYKMGYENLGIALFNKAADLQHKNKDWVIIDLLEEALFWNPLDKKAIDGLNSQIDSLNLNPKSRSDRLDLAERARQRGNKRAALTELKAARALKASKELEKEIRELEDSLNSEHVVHITTKGNLEDIDCRDYMANVQARIKSAWDPPHSQKTLSTVAIFSIEPNGKVKNIKNNKPSLRKDFNEAAIKAINTVEWFREIPIGIKIDLDIQFAFDYNVYSKTQKKEFQPSASQLNFTKTFNQAKAYYRQKNFPLAIEKYKEALTFNVEDCQILAENHLSDSYYQLAKQSQNSNSKVAAEYYRQCLIIAPDYDRAEAGLSAALQKLGINPKDASEREKLIEELLVEHNYNSALVECRSILKIASKEEKDRFTEKLIQIQKMSRSASAKNNWEEFLKKNPNSNEARVAIAQCLIDMNEMPKAIELLKEVLVKNPQSKQAKILLEKLQAK